MKYSIDILKGLRPGILIDRELRTGKLSRKWLSCNTGIRYARICEIISGARKMTLEQSLKLERALGYDEGFLMTLQLYYDIRSLQQHTPTPDLSKLSPALFWDTKIEKIDWQKHKRAVIERVMAYGNEQERTEIIRFYGTDDVAKYATPQNRYRLSAPRTLNHEGNGSGI